MYAHDSLVLELTALLKAHGVRNIVISPGSRHYAFTRTFENDRDFRLHSVVDERSAAFFALGLIQATGEPAATICTSGTAALNYGSALAEAAAQKLPLVAITTDRLPEFLGQMEDQMIDQRGLFDRFVRYAGNLRPIANERDRWYCNRVINEALVAAREGGGGPVHLNVPIESHSGVQFTQPQLPDVRVITRHRPSIEEPRLERAVADRLGHKRVLLVWGQGPRPSERALAALAAFTETFDVAVIADHLANVHVASRIDNPLAFLKLPAASQSASQAGHPDHVRGEHRLQGRVQGISARVGSRALAGRSGRRDRGSVPHSHRRLPMPPRALPRARRRAHADARGRSELRASHARRPRTRSRRRRRSTANWPPIGASHAAHFPDGSALHIANSAPIRMAQLHAIDPSIDVFCNRGVNGIDGCLSTAIGYATETPKPTFVIIGDLAFFYDMNSLWIRGLPDNLRILLLNNGGGAVMHVPMPADYSASPVVMSARSTA